MHCFVIIILFLSLSFSYLQKHPKVDNHVYKEFERLQGIFGKDHANGHGVESATDVVENEIGENQVDGEDWLQHDNSLLSNGNTSARSKHFSTRQPLKWKCMDQLTTRFVEHFHNKMHMVMTNFGKMVSKMPDFSHLDPSKRDFKGEVQKLGFTEKQEYDLDLKFVENT